MHKLLLGSIEVSLMQKCPHFRIGIEGFHSIRSVLISGGWNRGIPLYTEVSSLQGVRIEGFHCIQRCTVCMQPTLFTMHVKVLDWYVEMLFRWSCRGSG